MALPRQDPPQRFVDPLTEELMNDPILLPSGNMIDRKTITDMNLQNDPFSREPLPAKLTSVLSFIRRN